MTGIYADCFREGKEPAAEIVPGYYDNFVRRVLDNVNQGLPVSKKIKHDEVRFGMILNRSPPPS